MQHQMARERIDAFKRFPPLCTILNPSKKERKSSFSFEGIIFGQLFWRRKKINRPSTYNNARKPKKDHLMVSKISWLRSELDEWIWENKSKHDPKITINVIISSIRSKKDVPITERDETFSFFARSTEATISPALGGIKLIVYLIKVKENNFS